MEITTESTNAEQLITMSITEDRTVTVYPETKTEQASLHEDLLAECDGDCSPVEFSGEGFSGPESRGYTDYWGTREDGNTWRVSVVNAKENVNVTTQITTESTNEEILDAYEHHRRNGNGEQAGRETDTPAEAAKREGWIVLREIPTHHNPGKTSAFAQDAADGLWLVCDIDGPWAIQLAE